MREKKKKMYLLAMAILLINTTSFGKQHQVYDTSKGFENVEHTTSIPVVSTGDEGIRLNSGDSKSLKVTNKVDIIVDTGWNRSKN